MGLFTLNSLDAILAFFWSVCIFASLLVMGVIPAPPETTSIVIMYIIAVLTNWRVGVNLQVPALASMPIFFVLALMILAVLGRHGRIFFDSLSIAVFAPIALVPYAWGWRKIKPIHL